MSHIPLPNASVAFFYQTLATGNVEGHVDSRAPAIFSASCFINNTDESLCSSLYEFIHVLPKTIWSIRGGSQCWRVHDGELPAVCCSACPALGRGCRACP